MRLYSHTAPAALLLAALLTACGGSSPDAAEPATSAVPAASRTETAQVVPQAKVGEPFRNGSWEVTVTKVEMGVKLIDVDETAKSGGIEGFKPENGQFVLVHVTAKNVGTEPQIFWGIDSTLTDSRGKEFSGGGPYLGGVLDQGLYDIQQPDTTRKGWIAFDVPLSVTGVVAVSIQSDPELGTANPPTQVQVQASATTPPSGTATGEATQATGWGARVEEIRDAFFAAHPKQLPAPTDCQVKTDKGEAGIYCETALGSVAFWAGEKDPLKAAIELMQDPDAAVTATTCYGKDFVVAVWSGGLADLLFETDLGCKYPNPDDVTS